MKIISIALVLSFVVSLTLCQNLTIPNRTAQSVFSYAGLIFGTYDVGNATQGTSYLIASSNETFSIQQTSSLINGGYGLCINPTYSEIDEDRFFLICTSPVGTNGYNQMTVFIVRVIQNLFFSIDDQERFSMPGNFTIIPFPSSTIYLFVSGTTQGFASVFIYTWNDQLIYQSITTDLTTWAPDLKPFWFTNCSLVSVSGNSYVFALTGYLKGGNLDVLVLLSSLNSYQIMRGDYTSVGVIQSTIGTSQVVGYTISALAPITLTLWDFTQGTSEHPVDLYDLPLYPYQQIFFSDIWLLVCNGSQIMQYYWTPNAFKYTTSLSPSETYITSIYSDNIYLYYSGMDFQDNTIAGVIGRYSYK